MERGRGYSRRGSVITVYTPGGFGGRRRTLTQCCLMCRGYLVTHLERRGEERRGEERKQEGEGHCTTHKMNTVCYPNKQTRPHLVYLLSG